MDRRSLLPPLVLAASAALALTPLVSTGEAAPARCSVANARSGQHYRALQDAVNAAATGDTLNVKGTCRGDTTISAGGPAQQLTIAGRGHAVLDGANSEHSPGTVIRLQGSFGGPAPFVTITGLTITGGYATGEFAGGGGIEVVESSLTLDASTVTGNVGGGIGNGLSNTTLDDSRVVENTSPSENGGGIRNGLGTVVLNNSIVSRNATGLCGGGIYDRFGSVHVAGSLVARNAASGDGGGICGAEGATVTLDGNSRVRQNRASTDGGGAYTQGTLTVDGSSSIVLNTAGEHGGGIYDDEADGGIVSFGAGWSGKVSGNRPDNIFSG
jgi:hypothetical protein